MIPRTLFSAEHELFRESVQRFIQSEVAPHHSDWERDGVVSREVWRKAGEVGLLCCAVPEEYGGLGADFLFSVVVMEELIRAGTTGPYFHLHSDIVAPYIHKYASEEQRHAWLPAMARGEAIGAIAMTEPSGGSDVQNIRTSARRDGDEYVINGQKVFISNGQLADVIVLAAQTAPGSGAKGITLFLVEANRPGFSRGRNLEKIGLKAQDTSELFFADVRVPVANRLGNEGDGWKQLMTELAQERLVQAIRSIAGSETAIEWTVDYVCQREVFGRPVAAFQNTQFKLAEMQAATLAQRVFVDRCIELHLQGSLDAVDAAMAKLVTTELQGKVLDECLQLFGGWGYMWEFPIARAFVDARQARISAGSVEVMKHIIGRAIVSAKLGK